MHKKKEKTFWSRGDQTPVSNEQAPQAMLNPLHHGLSVLKQPFVFLWKNKIPYNHTNKSKWGFQHYNLSA